MIYRERVAPGVWVYIFGVLIVPAVLAVFVPINFWVGLILGVALYAGICISLYTGSPIIEVTASTLRVGSARVPIQHVGNTTAFTDHEDARAQAGPKLDARAWTCLRGWVKTSAKVEITDEHDPVPYWLFSTRDPEAVNRAIQQARSKPKLR